MIKAVYEFKQVDSMKTRAFIFIVLAGIFWGTSGIFVHYLAPYGFSSIQMTAMRAAVSFLVMAIYVLIKNRGLFRVKPSEILFFLGSGLSFLATATFYFMSMQLTSVATSVVLMYTAPAIVMVYSVLFLGEKLTKLKGVAVAVMLLGCCLVSGVVGGMKFNALGIIFGVLSGISYSVYNILTKIEMKKGSSAISATLYNFLFAAIGAVAICNPINLYENFLNKPMFTVPVMIACGIVTCIAPYFLYTVAMKTLPAGTASALGIVEPMAATVFSVLILHESLNVFSAIGIILILGAVFLLGREDG